MLWRVLSIIKPRKVLTPRLYNVNILELPRAVSHCGRSYWVTLVSVFQ